MNEQMPKAVHESAESASDDVELAGSEPHQATAAERDDLQASPEPTLDRPVMDGAEEHLEKDEQTDPRRGMSDPALIRDVEHGKKTTNPYG